MSDLQSLKSKQVRLAIKTLFESKIKKYEKYHIATPFKDLVTLLFWSFFSRKRSYVYGLSIIKDLTHKAAFRRAKDTVNLDRYLADYGFTY